jgi:hypothetical protein
MVVECSNVNDLVAVLNEGMKNRKIGSHELNKDSSRSHSILTIYLISQTVLKLIRKMGEILSKNMVSFVLLIWLDLNV